MKYTTSNPRPLPTQARLKELMHYDEGTGLFVRLQRRGGSDIGSVAGTSLNGYIIIRVDGVQYAAHRLAWKYVYGEDPAVIDHKNRSKDDNRIANLSNGTMRDNMLNKGLYKNSNMGMKGLTWRPTLSKWHAQLRRDGRIYYLGVHKCPALAAILVKLKENELDRGVDI